MVVSTMIEMDMASEAKPGPDRDDPHTALLALVKEALALADAHGYARVGIYLDQAKAALKGEAGQSAPGESDIQALPIE